MICGPIGEKPATLLAHISQAGATTVSDLMVIFIFIRPVKCQRWTETVRRKSQSKLSHAGIFEIPENEGPASSGCWSHFHRNRCCFMKPWIDRRGELLNTEHSYFRVNLVRYEWHPLLRVCKIALQEILGWPSRSKSSRIYHCRIRKLLNPFTIHIYISILMEKATTKKWIPGCAAWSEKDR